MTNPNAPWKLGQELSSKLDSLAQKQEDNLFATLRPDLPGPATLPPPALPASPSQPRPSPTCGGGSPQFISSSTSWGSPSCGGGVVHQLIHEVVTSTDDGLAGNFKAVADLKSNAFFTPRTLCTLYTWSKRWLAEMANWDLWKYEIQRQRLKFKRLWDISLGARRAHHSS